MSLAAWLRQAVQLVTGADIWVVADTVTGWAGIAPRVAASADRAIAFPGLDTSVCPASPPTAEFGATVVRRCIGCEEQGARDRSPLQRPHRPHDDLRAICQDLRAVLMPQRQVHPMTNAQVVDVGIRHS
jgi:hypothetical protein